MTSDVTHELIDALSNWRGATNQKLALKAFAQAFDWYCIPSDFEDRVNMARETASALAWDVMQLGRLDDISDAAEAALCAALVDGMSR